jgi:hypothetical protein
LQEVLLLRLRKLRAAKSAEGRTDARGKEPARLLFAVGLPRTGSSDGGGVRNVENDNLFSFYCNYIVYVLMINVVCIVHNII